LDFKLFFIIIFLIKSAVHIFLNILNLKHLKSASATIPEEILDAVKSETSEKSLKYNEEKMKFTIFSDSLDIVLAFIFLFSPLFVLYVNLINSLQLHYVLKGLIFFYILIIADSFFDLPLSYYSSFAIEEKYGFNKYTLKKWFIDNLKNLALQIILISIILSLVLYLTGGELNEFKWKYAVTGWIIISCLLILFTFLVPVIIIPFFYKIKPIESNSLTEKINALLNKLNFKIKGIYSVDASLRSTHANAGFSGFGKSKKIIIFDTMLDGKYSDDEILSVLAHEIGHAKKKHILIQMILSIAVLFIFITFILYLLSSDFAYNSMGINRIFFAGLLFAGFFFENIFYFVQPLTSRLSRKFEFDADKYSKTAMNSAVPLISSFKKFIINDCANINPHPAYESFYYSHPSVIKRINKLSG